jgi:hypothetical protein
MDTNEDRVEYLDEKISQLNEEIRYKGLEDRCIEMLEQIAQGKLQVRPIDDDKLKVMLPKEREKYLLDYYITLRSELEMLKERAKKSPSGINNWLSSKWIKTAITIAGIVEFASAVVDLGHMAGLFYREESEDHLV